MSDADRPPSATPPIGARILSVGAFLRLGRFRAATVQRSFRWEPDDALRLLSDFETLLREQDPAAVEAEEAAEAAAEGAGEDALEDDADRHPDAKAPYLPGFEPPPPPPSPHDSPLETLFLGAIVLVRAADDVFEIYDGLQRTTTLTILAAVLRDLEGDRALRAQLNELLLDEKSFRLSFPERDETLERDVQRPGATLRIRSRVTARRPVGKRLQRVKNALLAALQDWPPDRRRRLTAFVFENVTMALFEVGDTRLARQIFVSSNLYGARLSPIETLKGQLLDCAASDAEEDEVLSVWTEIGELLGQDLGPFLQAVDAIERCEVQKPQWPTDLGEHVRRAYAGGDIGRWMRRLRRSAFSWRSLQSFWNHGGATQIEQDLWRLQILPWDEWRPLALFFWNRYYEARQGHADPTQARATDLERWCERVVGRLQRRCMALALTDISDSKRRMIFMKSMRTAQAGRDPTIRGRDSLFPTPLQRRKIDRALRSQIKNERIWGALTRWLEAAEWREGLPALLRGATVEHVLPRNPEPGSEHETAAGDAAEYDRLCYSLGNLAMLSRGANDLIGNWTFNEKRPILEEQAATFQLLRSVVTHKRWGAPQIEARAEELRLRTWKLLDLDPPM